MILLNLFTRLEARTRRRTIITDVFWHSLRLYRLALLLSFISLGVKARSIPADDVLVRTGQLMFCFK